MGVGSQRAALEAPELVDTYAVVKDYDIPLRFANIGASQIVLWGHKKTLENAQKMVDMIDADVFVVCLNFLQEVFQPEGEAHAKGCFDAIKNLAEDLDVPVVVKESGAGISFDVAKRLSTTKIAGIDVGGAGGTSFAAIEHFRSKMVNDDLHARGGQTFWDWGIPTPTSILEVGKATDWKLPIIATGGIRNGLDAAKAIVLGANGNFMIQPHLLDLSYGPEDFRHLSMLHTPEAQALVVVPDSPYKTSEDLEAKLKAGEELLDYSSGNPGSIGHLASVALLQQMGAKVEFVPFTGTAQGLAALLGGHIDFYVVDCS